MKQHFFVLGAQDPEMAAIAALLDSGGVAHGQATVDGKPGHLGNVYKATISDAVDAIQRMKKAIKQVIAIVDDMGVMRQELCEESIKDIDRRLMDMRYKIPSAKSLEEKLALLKDQREMERIRAARRKRLYDVMDNGAIYANDPLPRDELIALVAPLRELVTANTGGKPHERA